MKIGILTFHRAYNCGAMLQAWALRKTLEKMGHEAEFPVCNHIGELPRWRMYLNPAHRGLWRFLAKGKAIAENVLSVPVEDVARARYRRFRKRHLPERECGEDWWTRYDLLVVGSDQVWSPGHAGKFLPLFLGETWPPEVRGIAYGASWGDREPDGPFLERLKAAAGRLSGVSVRETYAREMLERAGVERGRVAAVADPVLLPEADEWTELARGVEPPREPYLFAYCVQNDARPRIATARALARRMGLNAVVAPICQYTRWGAPRGLEWGMSPERLVAYTASATCVLANSFHATAFGLLFGKPTLSLLERPDGGRSRPGDLLRQLGEEERLVTLETPLGAMQRVLERGGIAPGTKERLSSLRAESLAWLAAQLDGGERRHAGERIRELQNGIPGKGTA